MRVDRLIVLILLAAAQLHRADAGRPRDYLEQPDDWFTSGAARQIADHLLSWQTEEGGWPKNVDTTAPFTGDRDELRPTFDNSATTDELHLLARFEHASHDPRYLRSFERGLDYVLEAQYPNGGWPQRIPSGGGYHRHITFNDNTMVKLLQLMRDVASGERFSFVDKPRREAAAAAFERGIDCVLRCQVVVDGQLTAWCAQHDERNFEPRPARSYELASLSGGESVGIVRLLMSLDEPGPEVRRAVDAACEWYTKVKIEGLRLVDVDDPMAPDGHDRVLVESVDADPLWARFYEIGTNRPVFSGRDGKVRYRLSEIDYERRNGYAWLVTSPRELLERDYPAWKKRQE